MKKNIALITLLVSITCFTSFNSPQPDWQLKKSSDGIEVYTRDAENSDFKELKSVGHLKTSMTSIIALIYDWESYPQWVYKCGKSSTLKKISETELLHYQTLIAPWPATDRDFIVNIKIQQDVKTKIVLIKSYAIPDYIPPVFDNIRIKEFTASWTLTPEKDGSIELVYQLLVNPGGYVPAWIVNMAMIDGPLETMLNMKEWVIKEKYQKAKIPFIEEP